VEVLAAAIRSVVSLVDILSAASRAVIRSVAVVSTAVAEAADKNQGKLV
jgi:hypothetical protein